MQGYFVQFMAYTMAMVGFLSLCLITYKKLYLQNQTGKNSDCLCIENALRINPKKQIYVVRAGKERFLVASDAETTTMLAKLEDKEYTEQETKSEIKKQEKVKIKSAITLSNFKKLSQEKPEVKENPMMKRIMEKMKA